MSLAMPTQPANQRPGPRQGGGIWIPAVPPTPRLMNLLFLHHWEHCPSHIQHEENIHLVQHTAYA